VFGRNERNVDLPAAFKHDDPFEQDEEHDKEAASERHDKKVASKECDEKGARG